MDINTECKNILISPDMAEGEGVGIIIFPGLPKHFVIAYPYSNEFHNMK